MPRRYYRSRTRVIRPKKKWASNFKEIYSPTISVTNGTPGGWVDTLVENSNQSSNPTPVIVKAGNFKIQGDCAISTGVTTPVLAVTVYVIFAPEGITVASGSDVQSLVAAHPEYVMAWRTLDTAGGQGAIAGFSFSSRLKRNLNSGDKILLMASCTTSATSAITLRMHAMAQFWTCAN